MLRFLEAGLFAAARQFAAIMVVTLIVMLLGSQDLIDSGIWQPAATRLTFVVSSRDFSAEPIC